MGNHLFDACRLTGVNCYSFQRIDVFREFNRARNVHWSEFSTFRSDVSVSCQWEADILSPGNAALTVNCCVFFIYYYSQCS